jgi:hypothetical protein
MRIGEAGAATRPPAKSWPGLAAAAALLILYALFGVTVALHTHHRLDPSGSPQFYDFSAFYQAGRFADAGQAAAAYDDKAMIAAERAAFPGVTARLPWNYPPSFQLVMAPLAALPYAAAWLVWTIATFGLFAAMARRLLPLRDVWILLLAPAAAINLLVGQNGILTCVLMGAGVLALERRPFVGGMLLGLLSYKPHFAVLAPLLLLITRQWRALGGAVVAGAVLMLASLVLLGEGAWIGFIDKTLHPAVFSSSSSDWRNIPSVQILARSLGLPGLAASALQGAVALAAIAGAARVWLRTKNARPRLAVLAAASLLITPYLRVYDLTLLALPIAILAAEDEVPLAERAGLAIAWLLPIYLLFGQPRIQVGALATLAVTGLACWRALRSDAATKRLTLGAS